MEVWSITTPCFSALFCGIVFFLGIPLKLIVRAFRFFVNGKNRKSGMNNFYTGLVVYNMGLKRTSIEIDEELHAEVKASAARRGITIQTALEAGMRAWLGLPPPAVEQPRPHVRRVLDGVQALYTRQDKDARGMIAMVEAGVKVAGEKQPSSRRRADTE